MSHPELSSGGGSSLSSGKLSKLLVSVGDETLSGKINTDFIKLENLTPQLKLSTFVGDAVCHSVLVLTNVDICA